MSRLSTYEATKLSGRNRIDGVRGTPFLVPDSQKAAFSTHAYPVDEVGGSKIVGDKAASDNADMREYHKAALALLTNPLHPLRIKHQGLIYVVALTKVGISKPAAKDIKAVPVPGSKAAKTASARTAGSLGFSVKTSTGTINVGGKKSRGVLSPNGSKSIDGPARAALVDLVQLLAPNGSLRAKLQVMADVHAKVHMSLLKQRRGDKLALALATDLGTVPVNRAVLRLRRHRSGSPGGFELAGPGKAALKARTTKGSGFQYRASSAADCVAKYNDPDKVTSSAEYGGRGMRNRDGTCAGRPSKTPIQGKASTYASMRGAAGEEYAKGLTRTRLSGVNWDKVTNDRYMDAAEWSGYGRPSASAGAGVGGGAGVGAGFVGAARAAPLVPVGPAGGRRRYQYGPY